MKNNLVCGLDSGKDRWEMRNTYIKMTKMEAKLIPTTVSILISQYKENKLVSFDRTETLNCNILGQMSADTYTWLNLPFSLC